MDSVARDERIIQINLYTDEADESPVMQAIPHCISNRWSPLFSDINMRGNSKQHGIDLIVTHYGIALKDTLAFGDGGNDISMLRHAGIGIAMGNANDTVKQNADYVTDDIDNNGIVKALRHLGLL